MVVHVNRESADLVRFSWRTKNSTMIQTMKHFRGVMSLSGVEDSARDEEVATAVSSFDASFRTPKDLQGALHVDTAAQKTANTATPNTGSNSCIALFPMKDDAISNRKQSTARSESPRLDPASNTANMPLRDAGHSIGKAAAKATCWRCTNKSFAKATCGLAGLPRDLMAVRIRTASAAVPAISPAINADVAAAGDAHSAHC